MRGKDLHLLLLETIQVCYSCTTPAAGASRPPEGTYIGSPETNHQEMLLSAFLTHFAPNRVATTIAPTAAAAKKAAWIPV